MRTIKTIDDKGNDKNILNNSAFKWISPTKYTINGKTHSIDPNEQCFEMYNGSKCVIIMQNVHPWESFFPNVKVKPDEFAFFPHKYFIPWIDFIGNNSKEKIEGIIINYGGEMFKQNKKPSSPDNWSKTKG